jgi:hypothetical protein
MKQLVAPGFKVMSVEEVDLKAPALMAAVTGMDYIMYVPDNAETVKASIDALLAQEEVMIQRKRKQKKARNGRRKSFGPKMRSIDVRPNIGSMSLNVPEQFQKSDGMTAIAVELHRVGDRGLRPSELMTLIGYDIQQCHVLRLRTRFANTVSGIQRPQPTSGSEVTIDSSAQ